MSLSDKKYVFCMGVFNMNSSDKIIRTGYTSGDILFKRDVKQFIKELKEELLNEGRRIYNGKKPKYKTFGEVVDKLAGEDLV